MSKAGVEAAVMKWLQDEGYRKAYAADPHAALGQFDLTADEKAAIIDRNPSKVAHLNLDERTVKSLLAN